MARATNDFVNDRQMVFNRVVSKLNSLSSSLKASHLPQLCVNIHLECANTVIRQPHNNTYDHDLVMGVLQKAIVHYATTTNRANLLVLHRTECREIDRFLREGWPKPPPMQRLRSFRDNGTDNSPVEKVYTHCIKPYLVRKMSTV